MARNSFLELRGVPIEADGMDLEALDKVCGECGGKVKFATASESTSKSILRRFSRSTRCRGLRIEVWKGVCTCLGS